MEIEIHNNNDIQGNVDEYYLQNYAGFVASCYGYDPNTFDKAELRTFTDELAGGTHYVEVRDNDELISFCSISFIQGSDLKTLLGNETRFNGALQFHEIVVAQSAREKGLSKAIRTLINDKLQPDLVFGEVSSVLSVASRVKIDIQFGLSTFWMNRPLKYDEKSSTFIVGTETNDEVKLVCASLQSNLRKLENIDHRLDNYDQENAVLGYEYPRGEGNQYGVFPEMDPLIDKFVKFEKHNGCHAKAWLISLR